MPKRLLHLATSVPQGAPQEKSAHSFSIEDVVWAMGSFCALNRKPFDAELLSRQFPPPYTDDSLIHAARALGFRIKRSKLLSTEIGKLSFPCLAILRDQESTRPAIVVQADINGVDLFEAGSNTPTRLAAEEFAARFTGTVFQLALASAAISDPDQAAADYSKFGFRWFIPELLKHKRVWRDVIIASLVIQLLALGTPLFTQVVIDKVIVQHTQSTLIAIAIGMAVFMIFSAMLTWIRQYLVLHTGNRVDAVLASAVFEHLFKLPPRYFEKRPTGVIAARLDGVETIREFIASAAVTLMLDLPFLLIFVGIMFWYSVTLSLIALAILAVIVLISAVVAPMFQAQLNHQFLLGARNQAFITEYVSGVETVKAYRWNRCSSNGFPIILRIT